MLFHFAFDDQYLWFPLKIYCQTFLNALVCFFPKTFESFCMSAIYGKKLHFQYLLYDLSRLEIIARILYHLQNIYQFSLMLWLSVNFTIFFHSSTVISLQIYIHFIIFNLFCLHVLYHIGICNHLFLILIILEKKIFEDDDDASWEIVGLSRNFNFLNNFIKFQKKR